jgi:hypothetical protein
MVETLGGGGGGGGGGGNMRDYKTQIDCNNGYKSSLEVTILAVIFAYFVAELSWEQIEIFFGF